MHGFYLEPRQALAEKERESITITVKEVSPYVVGMLIALFERAVGIYASLINVNAYHQPGVEAGKKAAGKVIEVQCKVFDFLFKQPGKPFTVEEIANGIGMTEDIEQYSRICEYLSANADKNVHKTFDRNILRNKYAAI